MAKADMNRSELAELTGYSVEQIVSWERGRARMYPIELVKLCHALDVKPEWLLCWERFLAQNISSSRIAKTLPTRWRTSPSAIARPVCIAAPSCEPSKATICSTRSRRIEPWQNAREGRLAHALFVAQEPA